MVGLARTIRLVAGLGMIAAGSSLAAPAGIALACWLPSVAQDQPVPPAAAMPAASQEEPVSCLSQAPAIAGGGPDRDWPGGDRQQPASPALSDYAPPPVPQWLPPVPPGMASAGPDLSPDYRTTLAVPPPPLLDGQRPPPLAVGRIPRGENSATTFQRPPAPAAADRYRIQDGDDLTAIAIRFYGTPTAAAAIWQANREIIRDPGLLPIGAPLVLPRLDVIAGGRGREQRRSIEPAATRPTVFQPGGPTTTASWLQRD